MNNIFSKKSGFTLIELLIASTIFAMIMVIVVGIFSWAAGYNNKLKETRKVAQDGRMIMSEISKEIRLANGSVMYRRTGNLLDQPVYIGEIVLFNCDGPYPESCNLVGNTQPLRHDVNNNINTIVEPASFASNAILILQKDRNRVIFYRTLISGSDINFVKKEVDFDQWDDIFNLRVVLGDNTDNPINDLTVSTQVYFGGFGPTSDSDPANVNLIGLNTVKNKQPYVEFYLIAESDDYDNKRPDDRAKFEAKSLVETRYYN